MYIQRNLDNGMSKASALVKNASASKAFDSYLTEIAQAEYR
jgi:hypothetical protein